MAVKNRPSDKVGNILNHRDLIEALAMTIIAVGDHARSSLDQLHADEKLVEAWRNLAIDSAEFATKNDIPYRLQVVRKS